MKLENLKGKYYLFSQDRGKIIYKKLQIERRGNNLPNMVFFNTKIFNYLPECTYACLISRKKKTARLRALIYLKKRYFELELANKILIIQSKNYSEIKDCIYDFNRKKADIINNMYYLCNNNKKLFHKIIKKTLTQEVPICEKYYPKRNRVIKSGYVY